MESDLSEQNFKSSQVLIKSDELRILHAYSSKLHQTALWKPILSNMHIKTSLMAVFVWYSGMHQDFFM